MRSLALLVAAMSLMAEAPPQTSADLQQYEQALASFHIDAAAAITDRLIHERVPSDGKPRSDPLLNALIGRLYLVASSAEQASAFLDRAPTAELPQIIRASTALDHARTLDLRGDTAGALAAYREAAAASLDQDQRQRAEIGIGRELAVEDPAAARDQLLPIANGPAAPHRWEARYLLAMSTSLLGDKSSASNWAEQAWSDAADAPLTDLAPLRVATLRAGLAAARGDSAAEQAMLAASHGLALGANASLTTQLPVCGDSGLKPTDFVVFGYVAGPFLIRELVPIAASRAAAVAPFRNALGGFSLIKESGDDVPAGTVFTVRCRTLVSPYLNGRPSIAEQTTGWIVDHGLYYASVFGGSDDAYLNKTDAWIDTLAARFGKDSPLLVMPRWQVLTALEARALAGDPVLPAQLADLRTQIAAGMRRAGAPEWIAHSLEMQTQLEQIAQAAANGSNPVPEMQQVFHKELLEAPFDVARQAIVESVRNYTGDWPAAAAQIVVDMNQRMPASLPLRERQSWAMLVAEAQHDLGKPDQARATLLAAGLPKDTCQESDSDPKLLDQHFSPDDYPQNLMIAGEEGAVLFDFGLSPAGAPTNARILYSLPSGIFDQVSAKGFASVRFTAPTRSGAAISCEALTQPIRWQLEGETNLSVPVIAPQSPGPTT